MTLVERLRTWAAIHRHGAIPADHLAEAADEIERLRAALEIIAGRRQCLDNLMSHADIARAALTTSAGKSE